MTRRVRIGMFFGGGAVLAVLLVWASVDLPSFGDYRGPYGGLLTHVVPQQRHLTEVVTGTVFDVRGFDTLGEEFILFTAVSGLVLLLRQRDREEADESNESVGSSGVRMVGSLCAGVVLLVGLWVVAFGYVTPGGGFQGGVAVASGLLLLWLVSSFKAWQPVGEQTYIDPFEGLGAGGYVVIGLAALASGLPYLTNLFGPGVYGTLRSGGSVPFVNWAAGIEVTAAMLIMFSIFLEEYVRPIPEGRS